MSNSLDPDQARHLVGPDLGPSSLQRIAADDTRGYRVIKKTGDIFNVSLEGSSASGNMLCQRMEL